MTRCIVAVALGCLALLSTGCASMQDGGSPDVVSDITHHTGNAIEHVIEATPLGMAAEKVNEGLHWWRKAITDPAKERALRARQWELCRSSPCAFAQRCEELFPEEFLRPDCGARPGEGGPALVPKPIAGAPQPPAEAKAESAAVPPSERDLIITGLADRLTAREGEAHRPYCIDGKPHTGIGHLLTDAEKRGLLCADIEAAEAEAKRLLPQVWAGLGSVRQAVVWELCFVAACASFKEAITAIREGRWDDAGAEIVDSEFGRDDPDLADRMAQWMRTAEAT